MKASIKTVDITPAVGMQMAGYSERDHGAEGIHDDLCAKCFVLDDGENKVAIVICDVINVDAYLTNAVRQIVSSQSDIKADHIMIQATHTHSGPYATRLHAFEYLPTIQTDPETNKAYYHMLIQKIAGGILWANRELKDAKIGFGSGSVVGLSTNRNDPATYADNSANIIRIDDLDGNLVGIISQYTAHPTVLNHENFLFTADYPGAFRKHMEAYYPNVEIVFAQGCAGSISTRYTKKASTYEEADRLAQKLVAETIRVLTTIETTSDIKVNGAVSDIDFNVIDFLSDEEYEQSIAQQQALLDDLKTKQASASDIRKAYVTLQGITRKSIMKKNINFKQVHTHMQVLDLGVCTWFGIPGDTFAEIGRDIKALCKNTIVSGYTNDTIGYIVSKEGYQVKCYELNMTILKSDAHDKIVDTAKHLLSLINKPIQGGN